MLVTSIDLETGGLQAGYHEIIDINCITFDLKTWKTYSKIHLTMCPQHINRVEKTALKVNGYTLEQIKTFNHPNKARSAFHTWHEFALDNERILPIGHNYAFDRNFLITWLGFEEYARIFHYHYRDTQIFALGLKDKGKLPEDLSVSLGSLTDYFNIPHKPHNGKSDTNSTILVYKELLNL